MYTIRRIRPDDHQAYRSVRLAALLDAPSAFSSTYAESVEYPNDYWSSMARTRSRSESEAIFLAVDPNGRPVGLVGVYQPDPIENVAELFSMWVAPEARRGGVGDRLVEAALGWVTDLGLASVWLWVVRGNNGARRLYQRKGFETTGEMVPLPSDPCRHEERMVLRITAPA